MSEMIHELIFDFVNGKTKSFKFMGKESVLLYLSELEKLLHLKGATSNIEGVLISLNHVCSITYETYPKPEEE